LQDSSWREAQHWSDAIVTAGEERDRLWKLFPFPEHEAKAGRTIPVVVLERR
jgi:hypothetical protein